ncbi:MAG: MgtC/SapB family protein [Nevskia sp.]|nr:MgtC/SapB family protein [Nevskia sp.]
MLPPDSIPSGLWMVGNMALALLLGWVVGYERYSSGRTAGSQVYCLVCTTSCAVTLIAGYPSLWYWGTVHDGSGDPTRVINAILTGIGFLGAGIIVQTGISVRGLTTAASIWGSAAIGILVGVGFYLPAIGLAALFVVSMAVVPKVNRRLPAHAAIKGTLRFREGHKPDTELIQGFLAERGLRVSPDSLAVVYDGRSFELHCLIFARAVANTNIISAIAKELSDIADMESFTVTHSSRA